MLWTYYWSYILIIPGIIFATIAQILVKRTFARYSTVPAKGGWTADAMAEYLLRTNGCNVSICKIRGDLTDNYNPATKILSLSDSTYCRSGIAALGVAAHEVGHAVQDKENYFPLRFRSFMVPIVNIGSRLALPLVFIGFFLDIMIGMNVYGNLFIDLGIVAYSLATVFSLLTLPVEFNASRRAVKMLAQSGALDESDMQGVKKVLTAAALTYVASMFVSLLYLFRFLLIISNSRRNK